MFDLIVSRGRVADRKSLTTEGAIRTARALEQHYGVRQKCIGKPAPATDDDWSVSLPQANDTLVDLSRAIAASIEGGAFSAMVAGTCSASLASIPVVSQHYPDAVVLWVDAHGDFNTPGTTQTGYLGGMVLSAVCGLWDSGHGSGLRAEQVILVGTRDIDQAEDELLRQAGVRIVPPNEVTPATILGAIGGAPVWIHIDWDALEPGSVPADYEVPNGISPGQLRAIFEAIEPSQILGVELAEFQPPDDDGASRRALSIILDTVAPLFEAARTSGRWRQERSQ
jgi:arginase family enzyme